MQGNTVTVLKTGNIINIPEEDLRKGDLVLLQAGDIVPADIRLVEARGLEVDQWELTGEPLPAEKRVDGEDVYLYRGSTITRGEGTGIVVATGEETEYGRILKQSQALQKRNRPVLVKRKYLILPVLLVPPLIFSWSHGNQTLISLLALTITSALILLQNDELFRYLLVSRGVKRIERQNIRIRNSAALDVIPQLDLVCLDKTGVLTTRELSVGQIHYLGDMSEATSSGSPEQDAVRLTALACALCNDVFVAERLGQANPIDRALIAFALSNGFDIQETALKYRRIYDKPFDSKDRYMVSGFELDDKKLYFAKGDPEVVWKMCRSYATESGTVQKIDLAFLQSLRTHIESINQRGDIAIGMAYGSGIDGAPPPHYTFLCLIQLQNPLHPGVPDLVAKLREARIRTVILTGDRPEVATEVGRQARIDPNPQFYLTGGEIERMPLLEVERQSAYVSVFARLLPSHKGILIRLFQRTYHFVAMVGDGANDTIALKAADVAISFLKNGSPMAQRVSDILISDVSDLLTVIREAMTINWQVGSALLYRDMIVVSILLAWYAWNLRSLLFMVPRIWGAA